MADVGGPALDPSQNTVLLFPPSMMRILADSHQEIGGMLTFEKHEVILPDGKSIPNCLVLDKAEFVAGEDASVDFAELMLTHAEDERWITFHSHPISPSHQYLGPSGPDLTLLFMMNLMAGIGIPTVLALLFAQDNIYLNTVNPSAYMKQMMLLGEYVNYRTSLPEPVATVEQARDEFFQGVRHLCHIAEIWLNKGLGAIERWTKWGRIHPEFGLFQGAWDDMQAMTVLDAIEFTPEDIVTQLMLSEYYGMVPALESGLTDALNRQSAESSYRLQPLAQEYLYWFWQVKGRAAAEVSGVTEETILAAALQKIKSVADEGYIASGKGLFYSIGISVKDFKVATDVKEGVPVEWGLMQIPDYGDIYNNFIESIRPSDIGPALYAGLDKLIAAYKSPLAACLADGAVGPERARRVVGPERARRVVGPEPAEEEEIGPKPAEEEEAAAEWEAREKRYREVPDAVFGGGNGKSKKTLPDTSQMKLTGGGTQFSFPSGTTWKPLPGKPSLPLPKGGAMADEPELAKQIVTAVDKLTKDEAKKKQAEVGPVAPQVGGPPLGVPRVGGPPPGGPQIGGPPLGIPRAGGSPLGGLRSHPLFSAKRNLAQKKKRGTYRKKKIHKTRKAVKYVY